MQPRSLDRRNDLMCDRYRISCSELGLNIEISERLSRETRSIRKAMPIFKFL